MIFIIKIIFNGSWSSGKCDFYHIKILEYNSPFSNMLNKILLFEQWKNKFQNEAK